MRKKILSLTEIRRLLQDRKLYVIADKTGLSYPTLKKLADGIDANYTLSTLEAVSEYLTNK